MTKSIIGDGEMGGLANSMIPCTCDEVTVGGKAMKHYHTEDYSQVRVTGLVGEKPLATTDTANKPNLPFPKLLDEILSKNIVTYDGGKTLVFSVDDTKHQLLTAIEQLSMEVIGKDDRDYSQDNAAPESLRILVATATACNELRAEQRAALKKALGK